MGDKNKFGFNTEGFKDGITFERTESIRITFNRIEEYQLTRNNQPKNDGYELTKSESLT